MADMVNFMYVLQSEKERLSNNLPIFSLFFKNVFFDYWQHGL